MGPLRSTSRLPPHQPDQDAPTVTAVQAVVTQLERSGGRGPLVCYHVCSEHHTELHTMALVRTNITIPEDVLAMVDEVAGPRGRSTYISDAVSRQVRRDRARKVFQATRGALKESAAWGRTPGEIDLSLREVRDSWDRDERVWAKDVE